MESSTRSSPPPPPHIIQFPLCLPDHEDENFDENRKVVDEMDFFSEKDRGGDDHHDAGEANGTVNLSRSNSIFDFKVNTGLHLLTAANTGSDQSIVEDGSPSNSDRKRAISELAVLQDELKRKNSENLHLREMLNQVTSNYQDLQMHLFSVLQQQTDHNRGSVEHKSGHGNGYMAPRQFMDLGLAAAAENGASISSSEGRSGSDQTSAIDMDIGGGEDLTGENKVPRLGHSPTSVDQAAEATMRKARVSVRARSEAPMITDGCQWRKYGQKLAKGNPCPRAYYRCTMAAGCPVRKQVQRCAEDRSILITTYEGNHNHPLPPAALTMASTTSSAARMLLSGSMPSADGLINSNFLARTLLPCSSSMATISASAPFPTVTLDLTQSPNPLQFLKPSNPWQGSTSGNPATTLQIFGQALYNQSKFSGLQMSQDVDQGTHQLPPPMQHGQLSDTLNSLTTDPNFAAALAAAITSIIGGPYSSSAANAATTSSNNDASVPNTSSGNNKLSGSPFEDL